MKVVIIGSRTRDQQKDEPLVNCIIDNCLERFSKVLIVTKSCDKGVGKIIYDRCKLPTKEGNLPEFDMIEVNLRHILQHELPRPEFLGHFNALNAALEVLGDEFHILTDDYPTGAMSDMVERIVRIGAPYSTYKPSDPVEAKVPRRDS